MYLATASYSAFFIIHWGKKQAPGNNVGHYYQFLMFYSHHALFGKEYEF